jgi:hypothetical protein
MTDVLQISLRGGGQVGVIAPREGEDLILARTVGHLRIESGRVA